jgi:hypothetical protein
MRDRAVKSILVCAILIGLCGHALAKTYAPLKYRADYAVRGDDYYFLDYDGDGGIEFFDCSYGNTGVVNAYDENGKFLWTTWFRGMQRAGGCTPVGEDITKIFIGDLNYNKDLDIIAASKVRGEKSNMNPITYYERETVEEFNVHILEERWRYNEFDGIVTVMTAADINQDSNKEIIVGSAGGFVYVLGNNGVKTPESFQRTVTNRSYLFTLPATEVEESLKAEIIPEEFKKALDKINTKFTTEAFIKKYNGEGDVENLDEWMINRDKWKVYDGKYRYLLVSDPPSIRVYKEEDVIKTIYTYRMQVQVLSKYALDGSVYSVYAGDIDGDSSGEIIAGTYKSVYLIDDGKVKWSYPVNKRVIGVAASTDIAQGYAVTATDAESIYYIGADGKLIWSANPGKVAGITAADLDNDTSTEVIAALENKISAYDTNGRLKWEYALGENVKKMLLLTQNLLGVGSAKSAHLLETDNSWAINQSGYEYYLKAYSYYTAKVPECDDAKNFAMKAQGIFAEINNTEGAMRCDEIIRFCNKQGDEKKLADQYLSTAQDYFDKGQYDDARSYASRAMEIYAKRGDNYSVVLCDQLLQKIEGVERERRVKEADKFYSDAYWAYTTNDFENATIYLEKALRAYRELNYATGIANCEHIYAQMDVKRKTDAATALYDEAKTKYQENEYNESMRLTDQALEIFMELNASAKIEELTSMRKQAEKKQEADGYFALAESAYNSGDYAAAAEYANRSKQAYMGLENYKKAAAAEDIMTNVKNAQDQKNLMQMLTLGGTAAAVILTVAIIVGLAIKIKNKKKEDKNEDINTKAWASVQQGQADQHPYSPGDPRLRR